MPSDTALPQSITVATLPGHIEQKYLIIHVEQHVNYCNFNIVRHFLHDGVRRIRYEPLRGNGRIILPDTERAISKLSLSTFLMIAFILEIGKEKISS